MPSTINRASSAPCLLAIALTLLVAVPAQADLIARYRLHDHPNGNSQPPLYGLRLDRLFGGNERVTFSFDQGGAEMFLDVRNDGPNGLRIDIAGTVFGGIDAGTAWTDPAMYDVSFSYVAGVSAAGGGWQVADSSSNSGSISTNGGDQVFDLGDDVNNSFYFLPDGHRIGGDNSTWVGRGWLAINAQNPSPGTQDWLFTGELVTNVVPAPTSALLGFMGLCMVGVVRRR